MTDKTEKIIFSDGEEYLSLVEIAQEGPYRIGYLTQAVRFHKLKAFKAGDNWFTSQKWLADYQSRIRDLVDREVDYFASDNNSGDNLLAQAFVRRWFSSSPQNRKQKTITKVLSGIFLFVLIVLVVLLVIIFLSYMFAPL